MGNPYNSQSISGYNSSPPPDDGSEVAANQLSWAKHKTKLGDPLKTLAEGINTEALAAFGKLPWYTSRSVSSNDTMVAADERKVISFTNSPTFTLLPAATAGNGFTFLAYNAGSGTVTLDGDSAETINGSATYTLDSQYETALLWTNGAEWFVLAEKVAAAAITLSRGYLAGLQISNNSTDSDHDIDIAVGECRGSDDDEDIALASVFVKQIDASWSAGTNQGGLSSSLTLSADTWYHVHAINVGGSSDVGFDTSITAANLVTDHSATAYRRIGSVLTDGSSNIIAFVQWGDEVWWQNPPLDVDVTNQGTSATTRTLSVPTGLRVRALLNVKLGTTGGGAVYIRPAGSDIDDEAPSGGGTAAPLAQIQADSSTGLGGQATVLTNSSSQITSRASAVSTTFRVVTLGWIDHRGRDD